MRITPKKKPNHIRPTLSQGCFSLFIESKKWSDVIVEEKLSFDGWFSFFKPLSPNNIMCFVLLSTKIKTTAPIFSFRKPTLLPSTLTYSYLSVGKSLERQTLLCPLDSHFDRKTVAG